MKQSLLTLLVASVAVTAILARPISANAATVYVEYFNTIKAFASDGSATTFANTGLDAAQGLAFDTAGNLFAANYYDSNIVKFSSSGSYLGVFANTA